MREIKTEIEIVSSNDKIWSILMDFNKWQEWSPIINKASGEATLESVLEITMSGEEGKDGPKYTPVIIDLQDEKYFRWRAKMMAGFLFTNDKIFELEESDLGVKLIHKELFSGMLVPLFWSKLEDSVPKMLDTMNKALKEKAEAN